MEDILNYDSNTRIKGKKIKEWIKFHAIFQTPYTCDAMKMLDYLNISDDKEYIMRKENCEQFCVYECT